MRCFLYIFFYLTFASTVTGQQVENPEFQKRLETLLENNVPTIDVKDAFIQCDNYTFLDAREKKEFQTSHIPEALHIGYDFFSISNLDGVPKESKIIIYCSVGYRSEKITQRLIKEGYTNVFNLYGSIFEWANQEYPLEDERGNTTREVHTYNKAWSKWIDHPDVVKVW